MSIFKVSTSSIKFLTKGEVEFVDLTEKVQKAVLKSAIKKGLAHVFAPHATGIIILTENEPNLINDIKALLENLVPKNENFDHPSNAHSHLRSILLSCEKTLPVIDSKIQFGVWQSIMFVETDVYPRERTVIIQVIGET